MEVRPVTVLCLVYIAVIFYGALLPFDMTADAGAAFGELERELTVWYDGFFNNRRDILLNGAFFFPLGMLAALRHTGGSRWRAVLAAGGMCAVVSLAVEFLQLWSPSRTTEVIDVMTNTAGGLGGGVVGVTTGRSVQSKLSGEASGKWSLRPLRPVAIALLILLLLDATDPFYPVTHKSTLEKNFTNSSFVLSQGMRLHSWHHWLVCRVGMYAVLAGVIGASAMNCSRVRWVYGAVLASSFALATEACKPFIEDRRANIANVVVAACGAALGMLLGIVFHRLGSLSAKLALAAVLLVGYVSYHECRPAREDAPFDFVWDPPAIQAKIPSGAGWFPAHSFAVGKKRVEYVRPVVRILTVMAAFTYVLSMSGRLAGKSSIKRIVKGALLAGIVGAALQTLKLLVPERGPEMARLSAFVIGGALGVWIHNHAPPLTSGEIIAQAE